MEHTNTRCPVQVGVSAHSSAPAGIAREISLAQVPPVVVAVTPEDGAENVPLETAVRVFFSEPVAADTVTGDTLSLAGPGGPVPGTLTLSAGDTQAIFRPEAPLEPDTLYTLTVSEGIEDRAGYGLPSPITTSFTSLDTMPPEPGPRSRRPAGSTAHGRRSDSQRPYAAQAASELFFRSGP